LQFGTLTGAHVTDGAAAGVAAWSGQVSPPAKSDGEEDPFSSRVNHPGDMTAFLSATKYIIVAILGVVCMFSFLRRCYPLIFSNNVLKGSAPFELRDAYLGWLWATYSLETKDLIEPCGLDQAMFLEFTHLAMKITALVGIPMIFIMGPINYAFGGAEIRYSDMSVLSLSNVKQGSPLWWVYSLVVWAVAVAVQRTLFRAQMTFLERRFRWLRALPPVRANTVLVEGIPEQFRSDQKLFKFFEDFVCGANHVERAYVVKDTSLLEPKVRALCEAQAGLREAELLWAQDGRAGDRRPLLGCWPLRQLRPPVDSVDFYEQRTKKLEEEVLAEKKRLKKAVAQGPSGGATLSTGFVTFYDRQEAEMAIRLDGISRDVEEWVIDTPPCPTDVRWRDLTQDPRAGLSRLLVGYSLILALLVFYVPIVVGTTNVAEVVDMGPFQPLWRSFAPTAGLQIMVALLPTLLLSIFRNFFTLKAHAWAQRELHDWFFWFQLVYVVLATAIGRDFKAFVLSVCHKPLTVVSLLAGALPFCTHFFMNYILINWFSVTLELLRMAPLTKFLFLRRLYSEKEARELSEPEDQAYNGIGARSARMTIMLTIGLLYGTLSPIVNALILVHFTLCRLTYGYLVPFAETKKNGDLGGSFWVGKLNQVFIGLLVYCVVMVGIIDQHAGHPGPVIIALPSVLFVIWSMRRFRTAFYWNRLPFQEIIATTDSNPKQVNFNTPYVQAEMADSMLHITGGNSGARINGRVRRAVTMATEEMPALRATARTPMHDRSEDSTLSRGSPSPS